MTTRIELGGEKLSAWLFKHEEYEINGQKTEIIAELPDEPDTYQTDFGEVSFWYESVTNGGGDLSPIVCVDCSKMKVLSSKKRIRRINIDRDNNGFQQLRAGVNILFHTDLDLSKYRTSIRENIMVK